jgi:hypothetical protein
MSEPAGEPAGIADELRRFIGDIQAWVGATVSDAHHLPTGPECGWCPLCQFADLLRSDHPEAGERVKQAGAALIAAFRAVMQAAAEPPRPHPRPRPRPGPVDDGPPTGAADA